MSHKILVVDDEAAILQGFKRNLHRQFEIDTAESAQEAFGLIRKNGPYAVVVSDMRMPGMDGLQLLTLLKDSLPDTVRIMLTGDADQKTAVNAVNSGQVYRFINKPCSSETLADVLNEGLEQYETVQENHRRLSTSENHARQLTEELNLHYQRDFLTGLLNRQAIKTRMDTELQKMAPNDHHVLCIIDIDHFHLINNHFGLVAGDECLRQISQIITSTQRSTDLAGRMSGNRFSLLLRHRSAAEGKDIAEEILTRFRAYRFCWEDNCIDVNISIGLAPFGDEVTDFSQLLNLAETACYVAKDDGGNRLHIATPNDHELTRRLDEPQWVSRISQALENDHFVLFYQPIVPLFAAEGQGEHFEVLLRLRDEKNHLIAPDGFLPAAENYLLAPKVDCWVIHKLVEWFSEHPERIETLAMCSINLSGQSLGSRELLDTILNAFEQTGLPTQKFCFEITETAAISKLSAATGFIETLRAKGFHFSLDDFGSGLSSFAYLKNFPVDYLKIDGQFVRNIDKDPIDLAMVRSINEIGKIMGKKTIAEYVENDEIRVILKSLNVDYAQGYAISKPMELMKSEKSQ